MDTPASGLLLRPLSVADEPTVRAADDELAIDGFSFLLDEVDGESWGEYLARLARMARGADVPPDRVPATFLVAEVGGVIVGRTSVRHQLNEYLAVAGGHIGYGVRPGFRRRGYATEILRQSLWRARAVGVEAALVTCDIDNVGSATVIERCGGVLDGVVRDPGGGPPKRRYWITVPAAVG